MPPPTLNSEEPLNAPFGARCFLTGAEKAHELVMGIGS